MRAAWLLLVATTACGRVAFDPRSDASLDAGGCPSGYTQESTGCYRTGSGTATWQGAEAACEADARGAHLAVIDGAAEATIIDRYRPSPTDIAWIGATDLVTEGMYRTVVHQEVSYLPFAIDEPEGALEDCLLLAPNLEITDGECDNPDDYICEYDGIAAASVAWGVCPAGYTFLGTSCYRADVSSGTSTHSWLDAEAACEADGAGSHLVVHDAPGELDVVKGFIPSTEDYWVGATDLVEEGVYRWATGANVAVVPWRSGEPDGGTTENCATASNVPDLFTFDCADGNDFVCEYDGVPAEPAAWGQ